MILAIPLVLVQYSQKLLYMKFHQSYKIASVKLGYVRLLQVD